MRTKNAPLRLKITVTVGTNFHGEIYARLQKDICQQEAHEFGIQTKNKRYY